MNATQNSSPATAAKVRAAVWTRTDKTAWNVEYNDYSFAASKVDGVWVLYVWNEIADDWADAFTGSETALRPFWNAVTAWFPTSDYASTPNPLKGYTVASDAEVAEAIASINAEHEADAAIQLAEAEGVNAAAAAVLDEVDADNECPKCHATGTAKCVTKSGKVVKENGGRHAVRPTN